MASIFKPPYISSSELSGLILEYGEIVYNTTNNEFYTGNGNTGGVSLYNKNIPLSTSQLTNDSGFITEQDVVYPVTSVNGKTGAISLSTSDLINDLGFIRYRDTIARKIKYDTDTTDSVINVTFNPAYYIYYKTNYNISGGVMYFGAPEIPTGGDFVSSERVITFEVWVPASSEITTFTFNVIVPIDFPETLPLLDNQETTTHVFVYRMFWPTADNSNILNYKYQISYSYSF